MVATIFVVDSNDRERMDEAADELEKIMRDVPSVRASYILLHHLKEIAVDCTNCPRTGYFARFSQQTRSSQCSLSRGVRCAIAVVGSMGARF